MAIDTCAPCTCSPEALARGVESYRAAVLTILCEIAAGGGGGGGGGPVQITESIPLQLAAGAANIGDVDVASIAAGDNNIGNVDIVSLPAIPAGTNNIGDVDVASIAAGDNNIGNVDVVSLPAITGAVSLSAALPAGTNNIGDVDIASAIPAGNNNIGDVDVASIAAGTNTIGAVTAAASTTGGYSVVTATALTTTVTTVKASAQGKFGGWAAYNPNNVVTYIQVFNVATAGAVTLGTTVPTFFIPLAPFANGFVISETGVDMSAGIQVAYTTTPTGSTAPATNMPVSFFFK